MAKSTMRKFSAPYGLSYYFDPASVSALCDSVSTAYPGFYPVLVDSEWLYISAVDFAALKVTLGIV